MTSVSQSVHENCLRLVSFWERALLKGNDGLFAAFDLKELGILTEFASGGSISPLKSQLSAKLFLVELTLGQS